MDTVKLHDKHFRVSITKEQLGDVVKKLANDINDDNQIADDTLFLSILNGSFIFSADLLRQISFHCSISFLKLASYEGTESSGDVKQLIGINENLEGRKIIILEDIVDTGKTLEKLVKELSSHNPSDIKIATLLYKPEAYKKDIEIDYIGLSIPNDFIVGYGLDYDGLGRNLPDIYTLIDES